MTILRNVFTALLLLATAASARQTYGPISVSSITSVSYTNATHGMGSKYFGVTAKNGYGTALQPTVDFTWTINSSSYQVDITFVNSFTGTIKLYGIYSAYTTDDHDFKVTSPSNSQLTVCSGCGSAYAARAYNPGGGNLNLVLDEESTVTMWCGGNNWSDYVYVFLTNTGIVYQGGLDMGGSCSGANCSVSITAYPSTAPSNNIASLGRSYLSCSTGFGGVTDLRPF